MKKIKVFISSTIYDFRDLRSALKYWLNEMGVEVQLSENPDFQIDPVSNSYESCLKNIENCDYFLLLIGSRVGGWYNQVDKISITQAEYRKAYELAKQDKIKIISFIRKDIYNIRLERSELCKFLEKENKISEEKTKTDIINHPSKFMNDAGFIISFIDEVTKNTENKSAINGECDFPISNWLYQFDSLEDIIITLRSQLNTYVDLQSSILGENVLFEVSSNLTSLYIKNQHGLLPYSAFVSSCRSIFPNDPFSEPIKIKSDELNGLMIFALLAPLKVSNLSTVYIKTALTSGTFYEYQKDNSTYRPSNIHLALQKMDSEVQSLKTLEVSLAPERIKIMNKIKLLQQACLTSNEIVIDTHQNDLEFLFLFALHDRIVNLIELSKYVYNVLRNPHKVYCFPQLYNGTLKKDVVEKMEDPTIEDISRLLES